MGFMDKVMATAEKAAEKAQQGVQQGQAKMSEIQERKRMDTMLRELGVLTYLDGAGRGSEVLTAEMARLRSAIAEAEAAGTPVEPPASVAGATPAQDGGVQPPPESST